MQLSAQPGGIHQISWLVRYYHGDPALHALSTGLSVDLSVGLSVGLSAGLSVGLSVGISGEYSEIVSVGW